MRANDKRTPCIARAPKNPPMWFLAGLVVCFAIAAAAKPALAGAQIGKFTVNFKEGVFHRNGDFVIPGAVTGRSPDGDFRADRAVGNYQRQDVTLLGHVLLHQRMASHGPPSPPMTLACNQLQINGRTKIYTATGSVLAVQGNRQLRGGYLQLNDVTHESVLRGNVVAQENDRRVASDEMHYNTASGALDVPHEVTGSSSDTDFRADRAIGNERLGIFTLTGNVLVHRFGAVSKGNTSNEPLTLWCDTLDIVNQPNQPKTYTATGHVRVAQGQRTLTAPKLALNDTTHVATMTGGVHGEEVPDRTFDAAELLYNTQSEDFRALGGVRATFPYRRGSSQPTAAPSLRPSPAPSSTP